MAINVNTKVEVGALGRVNNNTTIGTDGLVSTHEHETIGGYKILRGVFISLLLSTIAYSENCISYNNAEVNNNNYYLECVKTSSSSYTWTYSITSPYANTDTDDNNIGICSSSQDTSCTYNHPTNMANNTIYYYKNTLGTDYFKATFVDGTGFTNISAYIPAPITNQAPTLTGTEANQAVNDNATIKPFASIVLDDGNGDNISVVSISLNNDAYGTLSADTVAIGTIADVQATLRAIVFTPTPNRVAVGTTETTRLTITLNDGTENSSPDTTTTVVSTSMNDAPTDITLSNASVNQSAGVNAIVGSLTTTDVDTADSFTYALLLGPGDTTDNDSFNIDGTNLRANNSADLSAGTYSVRIQTRDASSAYQKLFPITVVDDVAPVTPTPASGGSSYTPPAVTPTPEEEKESYMIPEEEVIPKEEVKPIETKPTYIEPIARPTGNAEQTGTKPELDNVTRLYIATFGRAPESAGSIYWLYESKLNLEDIARSFFDQEETKGKYPQGFSNYDFIVAIYNHVYGRNPDQAGGDYWLKELDSGKIEKALFILAIINGAIGDDALMLGKQTTAGVDFVRSGVQNLDLAKKVIDDIKR